MFDCSKFVVVNDLNIPPKLDSGFGNELSVPVAGLKLYFSSIKFIISFEIFE